MADFIHFEAEASDESNDEGEPIDVDNSFIDDSMVYENNESSFFRFHNQTKYNIKINVEEDEHLEANNYLEDCEIDNIENESYHEFKKFEEKRNLFLSSLLNRIICPINIIYQPVKKLDQVIKCYFTNDLKSAYRALYHKGQRVATANTLYECYYCNYFGLLKVDMRNI